MPHSRAHKEQGSSSKHMFILTFLPSVRENVYLIVWNQRIAYLKSGSGDYFYVVPNERERDIVSRSGSSSSVIPGECFPQKPVVKSNRPSLLVNVEDEFIKTASAKF